MANKQGYKARQDESLGARGGARSKLKRKVSAEGRRKMASAPRKAAGGKKYGFIKNGIVAPQNRRAKK